MTFFYAGGNKDCCAYSLFYVQDGMNPHGHNEDELKEMCRYINGDLESNVTSACGLSLKE